MKPRKPRSCQAAADETRRVMLTCRFTAADAARLEAAGKARGIDRSTALRVAALAWADDVIAGRR